MTTYTSSLTNLIIEKIIYEKENSNNHTISKRITKIVATIICCIAQIPYISVSLKLNYGIFTYVLAIANAVGFATVGSWSIIKIIDKVFKPLNHEEKIIFKQKTNYLLKTIFIGFAILISISTQGIQAYNTYMYNKNIILFIGSFICNTGFPVYSIYLTLHKLFHVHFLSNTKKKLDKMKKEIIASLKNKIEEFEKMKTNEKISFLSTIKNLKLQPEKALKNYLKIMLKENTKQQSTIKKIKNFLIGFNGFHFALNNLVFLWILSYKAGKNLSNNKFLAISLGNITILSSFYLSIKLNIKRIQIYASNIFDVIICKRKQTLIEQLRPKLIFSLKSLGLLIAILSWAPSIEFMKDFIKNIIFRRYMQITQSISIAILISTAFFNMVDDIVKYSIKKGSTKERKIYKMHNNMKKFISILEKSSFLEFAKFIKDLKDTFNPNITIINEEIDQYISKNSSKIPLISL